HGLAVELGIVEAVQQVEPARSRGRQAYAEPARVLRITTGHERRRLLVADLDEADLVPALAQRLHDAVDAVAGQAEDDLDAPVQQGLDEHVRGGGLRHASSSLESSRDASRFVPRT